MTTRLAYLDTSAYVKLPLGEAGHEALLSELSRWDGYVSSMLLGVEAIGACAHYGPGYASDARSWLGGLTLVPLDDLVLDVAAQLEPSPLRTLDALHLATALTVKKELGAFFSFDRRLAEAAADHGLPVVDLG